MNSSDLEYQVWWGAERQVWNQVGDQLQEELKEQLHHDNS